MNPPSTRRHLTQFILARINAALSRLESAIWHSPVAVHISKGIESEQPLPFRKAIRDSTFQRIEPPVHWGRIFEYTWFRLELPREAGNGRQYLRWREQGEATLYIKGEPYYGFDLAHRQAPLPDGVRIAHVESMCCQSAIWHRDETGIDPQGSRLDGAEIVCRDDDAWHAWNDLQVLKEVLERGIAGTDEAPGHFTALRGVHPPFRSVPPWIRSLIEATDRAIDVLDLSGASAFRKASSSILRKSTAEWHQIPATLVGHAHIDLVWMWPERTGDSKAVHTFATALRMMEEYPEFRFSFSQPASYEAVSRLAPMMTDRIRERVHQKKWELLGAAYVESDTVIPCGEALLRSLYIGQSAREKWEEGASRVLWLPDVFGYSGCLPRLMHMAGIDGFFTNKVAWRRVSHFPHSSFRWRGNDGTEVLAHVSFAVENCYNGTATVGELQVAAARHRQSAIHREVLVPTGYGDGGGGPTEEMCERGRRLANLVSVPKARWGTVKDFFERMQPLRKDLPVWVGEIYLQMHRGTFTSQAAMKSAYRAAERGLQTLEAAHCVTGQGPIDERLWKRVVFSQFHDALPGSSFHEAFAELVPELETISGGCIQQTEAVLKSKPGRACWFNPLAQPVNHVVRRRGAKASLISIPPLAGVEQAKATVIDHCGTVRAHAGTLSNQRVKLVCNGSGEVRSLRVDGTDLALADRGGQLWVYPDFPHNYPAWEIDHEALALGTRVRGGRAVGAFGDGEVEGSIVFDRELPNGAGTVRVTYQLRADESHVRVLFDVIWKKPQSLLRWVFPTRYCGANARFGAPFGSTLRPQLPGHPDNESYWESPGSRWALVADDGENEGLFVVTEAKFGFEAFDGRLAVSMVRSPFQTGEEPKYERGFPSALRMSGRETFTDLGTHHVAMAFGLFNPEAPRNELPASLADTMFTTPVSYRGQAISSGLLELKGGASLVPAWVRPLSRDQWVLRLHETLGRRGMAEVRLAPGFELAKAGVCDGVGSRTSRKIRFGPYQVLSYVVRRS